MTLDQLKQLNKRFFQNSICDLFGDRSYEMRGNILEIHNKAGTVYHYADPDNNFQLTPVIYRGSTWGFYRMDGHRLRFISVNIKTGEVV